MMGERDSLIERYLNGQMSRAEEQTFRRRLDSDEQLLGMLRTELLIRSTIAGDRGKIPSDHSGTRKRAMALLATMPRGAEPAMTVSGGGTGGALSGTVGVKGIVGLMVAAAVAVGSYLMLPSRAPSPDAPRPASAEQPAARRNQLPIPPPPPAEPSGEGTGAAAAVQRPKEIPAGAGTPSRRRIPEAMPPAPVQGHSGTPAESRSQAEGNTHPTVTEPPASEPERQAPSVTIRNDTLRTRLKIEPMGRP